MRRFSILTFVTLIFLLVMSASVALVQAESPHFLPQTGQPSCTVTLTSTADGTSASVTCTGTLAGLANADLVSRTGGSSLLPTRPSRTQLRRSAGPRLAARTLTGRALTQW